MTGARRTEASPEAVRRATGRTPDEWFALLDAVGAERWAHRDIARWLGSEHDVSPWWCQQITVEYERARGLRAKYETTRGFQVSVSKTLNAPLASLYAVVADAGLRGRWLPGAPLTLRRDTPEKSTRLKWAEENGASNVDIGYYANGAGRSRITIQHSRLTSADEVEKRRAYWKAALERLAESISSYNI